MKEIGQKTKRVLQKTMFFVDSLPILVMISLSYAHTKSTFIYFILAAILLGVWHYIEKKAMQGHQQADVLYPGLTILPHLCYSLLILAAFVHYLVLVFSCPEEITKYAGTQSIGILLIILGTFLRVYALRSSYVKKAGQRVFRIFFLYGFYAIGMGVSIALCSWVALLLVQIILIPVLLSQE